MNRLSIWPWFRPFLILVLVVSIPPVVYWFGYVQSSVLAAKRQGYSSLAAVATEFRGRLAAHDEIAQSAERYTEDATLLRSYLKSVIKPQKLRDGTGEAAHLAIEDTSGSLVVQVGKDSAVVATVSLDQLLPWDVVETQFDGLLLLSDKGVLLSQDRRLPAQPLGVPVALLRAEQPADVASLFASDTKAGGSKKDESTPKRATSLFESEDDVSIRIGATEYLALLQPVSVSLSQAGPSGAQAPAPLRIVVGALISKDRLRREAVQLSPQTLIVVGSLVVLGLFAIPFLKLRFIGARERMHPRDVWLLTGAVLGTTALMTLLLLDVIAQKTLIVRFDAGLDAFSTMLHEHIGEEARAAAQQLEESLPKLASDMSRSSVVAPAAKAADCLAPPPRTPALVVGSVLTAERFDTYPDFEVIFTTDLCAVQQRKWMPRTIPTPRIRIAAEGYFEPALGAEFTDSKPYLFAVTRAPTSGLQLGVLATALGPDGTQKDNSNLTTRSGVGAIATAMRSINDPVVARPFEFVLVDRRGAVTFHSKQSFPGERIFDAIAEGAAIEAAARNGGFKTDTVKYRGRIYRMKADVVDALGMTLVTYYDRAIVGELSARTFGIAALLAIAVILGILAAALLSIKVCSDKALDWAWPSAERCHQYLASAGVCVAFIVLAFFIARLLPTVGVIASFVGVPFAIVFGLGAWYARRPSRTRRRSGSDRQVALSFVGCAAIALFTFVAWPTAIAFMDAFRMQSTVFTLNAAEQWSVDRAKAAEKHRASIADVGAQTQLPPQCSGTVHDARCAATDRLYATHANYTTLLRKREHLSIYDVCANLLGDQICKQSTRGPVATFTIALADWLDTSSNAGTDRSKAIAAMEQKRDTFVGLRSLSGLDWRPWHFAGVLGMLGALWLLVGSVARHVLGLGLTDTASVDLANKIELHDGMTWLALRPSRTLIERLRSNALIVDLTETDALPKLESPVAGTSLVLDKLHHRLADPTWRNAVLALLKNRRLGCLVLVSDIDPMHYLTQRIRDKCDYLACLPAADKEHRPEADKSCRELREELSAWASVMERVAKARSCRATFPAKGDTDDAAAYAILAEECIALEPLVDIGKQLLANGGLEQYTREDIIGFVLDAAEPYYRSLWELCGREERLVLIQLAQCGLVNPKRLDVARRLSRRGLLVVDPRFHLVNESFQRFVLAAEPMERVTEWERTHSSMSWSRMAVPLYALAAIVIAILLYTEQGLLTNILALATGSAATLGSLRNLYASVAKPAAGPKNA